MINNEDRAKVREYKSDRGKRELTWMLQTGDQERGKMMNKFRDIEETLMDEK